MWFWLKCVLLCTALTFPVPLNFPSVLTYQLLMALQVNIVMNTISAYSVFRVNYKTYSLTFRMAVVKIRETSTTCIHAANFFHWFFYLSTFLRVPPPLPLIVTHNYIHLLNNKEILLFNCIVYYKNKIKGCRDDSAEKHRSKMQRMQLYLILVDLNLTPLVNDYYFCCEL